jgi:hypothetical protein
MQTVFIDPSYEVFLNNRLFDLSDQTLNRDDQLLPFARLRERLALSGVSVHTADYLRRGEHLSSVNHYWSLGMLSGFNEFVDRSDVRLRGFLLLEPPLVAPKIYEALPMLSNVFEHVYVHNTRGEGYSMMGVDQSKLRKLYCPQPYNHVVEPYWSRTDRLNKVVVINGNHNPKMREPEYYSKRIEAVAELSRFDAIDLYGRGWDEWWSRKSMWLTYWRHRSSLMSAYRGNCTSKLDVLSRYRFCLCLENTPMQGYITEKIFDCLYAGVVPLYLGAPDVANYLPKDSYIDLSQFSSWVDMWNAVRKVSEDEWLNRKLAGRDFINSQEYKNYFSSIDNIFQVD